MTRSARGFTLVELCIVVAIIGVLAVVAGTAYRRYMDSARTSEAYAVLGEIRMKEEAYRAEVSTYLGLGSQSEAISNSFPQVDGSCKEPCYKDVTTGQPTWWTSIGVNPGKSKLQCGYVVNAGNSGSGPAAGLGQAILNTTSTLNTPWWYAVAFCDNDGNSADYATFTTGFSTTVVSAQNEHK